MQCYGYCGQSAMERFAAGLRQMGDGLKYREIYALIKDKGYTGTKDAIRGVISKEQRLHDPVSNL